MDRAFGADTFNGTRHRLKSRGRCAICARRPREPMNALEESAAVSGARLSWVTCERCTAAVEMEMQRANLRTPLRTRMAVASVASERGPNDHPSVWDEAYWANLSDEQCTKLVKAWILGMFIMAPAVFLVVTVLASAQR